MPTKKQTVKKVKKEEKKTKAPSTNHEANRLLDGILLPQRVVSQIAEEVGNIVAKQLKRLS